MIILKIDVFGNMDTLYQQLKNYGRVKLNEPMKKHTTFKIGGLARYFVVVEETNLSFKISHTAQNSDKSIFSAFFSGTFFFSNISPGLFTMVFILSIFGILLLFPI